MKTEKFWIIKILLKKIWLKTKSYDYDVPKKKTVDDYSILDLENLVITWLSDMEDLTPNNVLRVLSTKRKELNMNIQVYRIVKKSMEDMLPMMRKIRQRGFERYYSDLSLD